MKAVRVYQFGGPEVLKVEDVADPVAGPGQVVVKVAAIGINPVETYIRAGKYGPMKFPYTPGPDAAGVIQSVGAGVTSVEPGDRVYTHATVTGAYAEKVLCNESHVHPLPAHTTFQQGAALGVPYATSHRALFHRAKPIAGETLLVHGASGGVGIASVQFARAFGLTVIGTAGTDEGIKLVREEGAHHALNHHDPKYLEELMQLTGGRGVDIILEMASHTNLGKDLTVLAKYGRVIVIGSRGPVEITPRDGMGRDADIRCMTLMNASETDLRGIHQAIIAGLENKSLRPIIGKEFKLSDIAKAHEAVMESGSYGKIVVVPG
ncbi:MAG TPA: NADPH:quinone reductase [Tepidisphaeraceae bacterium]|jgi:NADPH2:quinone reductase|nr:NADPH:quinone reductase [Tepidisphaeraceae bacterium]